MPDFPAVLNPERVGSYPGVVKSGGGYVWDEVLEYRVWMYVWDGAQDIEDGSDYYYAFADYAAALAWSAKYPGAQTPLALVLQREFIDEPQPGQFEHIREERVTEWPVDFLTRPRRTPNTIPDFLGSDAPVNKLDILRGTAKPP